jgi:transcriptional regulator with XRE-family HTH domain
MPTDSFSGFPARLREKRKECGLSQGQLARRVGLSQPTINCYEHNTHYPNILVNSKIAEVLGVTPQWLAYGVGA